MHARRRQRLLQLGCPLLLLIVVATNVLYLDHWPLFDHDRAAAQVDGAVHAAHCHLGPKTCSEAGALVQVLPTDEELLLLLLLGGALFLAESRVLLAPGAIAGPLRKPPRLISQ